MNPNVDLLKVRLENVRRSTAMLPPHSTVAVGREELIDLIELVIATNDQVRGRGAAGA